MTPEAVRYLLALRMVEGLVAVRTTAPVYALAAAARAYTVSEGTLARLLVAKLIACARAREYIAELAEADASCGR